MKIWKDTCPVKEEKLFPALRSRYRRPLIDRAAKTNLHKNICPSKKSPHLSLAFSEGITSQDLYFLSFKYNDLSVVLFSLWVNIFFL